MIRSVNPATGEELAAFEQPGAAEIDRAVDAAVRAQVRWGDLPVAERARLLTAAARVLRKNVGTYAELITNEMGKPIIEAEAEVEKCAVTCDFYAENAARFLGEESVSTAATESYIAYEPVGVVLALMPWNFPFFQVFRFAAPALASGNAVILKHAENVPQCALAVADVLKEAGAPVGLFQTLLIGPDPVHKLIADPRIAAVTFTGSSRVGSIIGAQAGTEIKKQVLELGGSDPFIVLDDADVDAAIETAIRARNLNAGQSCISAKRFILHSAIADRFTEGFVAGVSKLKIGNPLDRATQIGPMARADLRASIDRQVKASVQEGAKILVGGAPVDGAGFFYQPTVLTNIKPDSTAFREETFGPAAALIRVGSLDEAIDLANRTEYGLGAALWTADIGRAKKIAPRIKSGSLFVNGMVSSDPRLPFGGVKRSGYGRELGVHGMREFTNIRTVWIGPATTPLSNLSE
ncbi:succinate-semialdehyde dehydrogenase [Terrihabitans soli]|uniref:Succinate-semialdehyde dehydrogenase n=1 Tax=Terrihabitans soli TaxID=708113 RepID=A0A6S6QQB3_9HYPH|nr:NAD-dependent succinate-semialdehyde dehydrogenase [Terrihabitans soli]BCJ89945.1 succinate-semialdehyde dehydrogenase [Terrihabitans soli]